MDSRRNIKFLLWFGVLLSVIAVVHAEEFVLTSAFDSLGLDGLPQFYDRFAIMVDSILVMVFFIFVTSAVGQKAHIGKKPFMLIGVILGLAFMMFEYGSGFRLVRDFGPIAALIFGIVFIIFLWTLLKSHTKSTMWTALAVAGGWLITEVLLGVMGLYEFIEQHEQLNMGMGILRLVGVIALITFVITMVMKLFARGGGQGAAASTNLNASPRDVAHDPLLGKGRQMVDNWRESRLDGLTQKADGIQNNLTRMEEQVENQAQRLENIEAREISEVINYLKEVLSLYENAIQYEEYLRKLIASNGRIGGAQRQEMKEQFQRTFQQYHQLCQKILDRLQQAITKTQEIVRDAHGSMNVEHKATNEDKQAIREFSQLLDQAQQKYDRIKDKLNDPQLDQSFKEYLQKGRQWQTDLAKLEQLNKQGEDIFLSIRKAAQSLGQEMSDFSQTYLDKRGSNMKLAGQRKRHAKSMRELIRSIRTNFIRTEEIINQKKRIIGQLSQLKQVNENLRKVMDNEVNNS